MLENYGKHFTVSVYIMPKGIATQTVPCYTGTGCGYVGTQSTVFGC